MNNRNVLIIEDNERNRYLASFILEKNNYLVTAAIDGLSGIEKALSTKPDIILLDIQLPGMNGYEVAKALREKAELKNSTIIAVTSYAMLGDREKALASGCDGYIEKPIDPETFVSSIEGFRQSATAKLKNI